MTPKAILGYTLAALMVFMGAAGVVGVLSYKRMAGRVATAEGAIKQAQADAAAAKRETAVLSNLVIAREKEVRAIRDDLSTLNSRIDKAKNEDPATRAVLGTRIPDGLRRAYTEAPRR